MNTTPGRRLKDFREALNFSTKELAERLNVSKSLIEKMESDQMAVSEKTAKQLQNIYKLPKEWLLEGIAEMQFETELSKDYPYRDQLITQLKSDLAKREADALTWKEKYEQAWSRLEFLLDRLPLGKSKSVRETALANAG